MTEHKMVYRVAELAAFLGWSEDTIRREIADGRLRARKLRADTVILEADLLAWLHSLPPVTAEQAPSLAPMPTPITATARPSRRKRVVRLFEPFAEQVR